MKPKAERSYRGLLWGLALTGFVLDQASKYGVFRWLYHSGDGGSYQIVPGVFELLTQFAPDRRPGPELLVPLQSWGGEVMPKVNHGALFGLGGEYVTLANAVFAVISLVAAGAIIFWSTRSATVRDRALCGALGLILAGTLGNFYDRVVFNGVRDFLHFYWFEFPVFNVADCCLVCGAFLLLAQAFFAQPVEEPRPAVVEEKSLAAEALR
jgi:lipoprotein signal peptidase